MKRHRLLDIHKFIREEVFVLLLEFDDGIICLQVNFTRLSIALCSHLQLVVVKLQSIEAFILYHKMKGSLFLEGRIVMIEAFSAFLDDIRRSDDDKKKQKKRREQKLHIAAVFAQVHCIAESHGLELLDLLVDTGVDQ